MKYHVLEIATGDAKVAGKAVYEYDTLEEATANFHSKLGTAMKSEMYQSALVMVISGDGGVYKSEWFMRNAE